MKTIRTALFAMGTIMSAIVAARMLFGPFHFGVFSIHTPLNPEGFFGLAITLLLLTRVTKTPQEDSWNWRTAALAALAVAAIGVVAMHRGLWVYFLSDDFILVRFGHEWTPAAFQYSMTHGGGDGFFRPFGYLSLALDARLGGRNPVFWHAISLALHAAISVLVLFIARRLGASALAAGFAGALFAVHAGHAEAVVWIAARFDLLATLLLLAGLLLYTYSDRSIWLHAVALGSFAVAAMTKESAFIFPLLVAGWTLWKRQPLKRMIPYFALAAILFAYRWSLFGGIGGYIDHTTGRPAALSLGLGSTLKAVSVRLWTALYFPLNWSADPALPLALLVIAYMAAMLWLASRTLTSHPHWLAAGAILISVIPILSLLAGSPSLSGGRVLYLPSVWFAILLALAWDGMPGRSRYAVAAAVLLFQVAALQHNLDFWEAASAQVKAACATGAPALPDSINGIPALANGRQECIEIGQSPP